MSIQWDDDSSPNVVWDNVQWDEPEPKSYAKRVLTESAPAVLNLIPDAINAGVAGLMGAGDAVGGMVRGKGIGPSLQSGAETFERGMESMREPGRPGLPRFHGKGVEESEQALMGLIEKGVGYVGDIAEDPLPFAQTQTPTEWLSPAGRTIGEAATNFIPVERAVKGFQGSQAAKQGLRDAQNILDRKQAGDTEYSSWEAEAAKNNEYYAATIEMDSILRELDENGMPMMKKGKPVTRPGMVRYPDDYQAPQFGLGGKMARNPDQVGNRTRGDYTDQLKYDEDIAQTAKDSQAWEFEQAETARRNKVLEVPNPMLDQGRRPVEGKTNIVGPAGRLKPEVSLADEVGMETRARMAERDRPPVRENPDSQAVADEVSGLMNRRGRPGIPPYDPSKPLGENGPWDVPPFQPWDYDAQGPYMMGVKDPGGNWHPEAQRQMMDALDARAHNSSRALIDNDARDGLVGTRERIRVNPDFSRDRIWYHFVERATRNYINRQLGTHKDPLKDIEIPFGDGTLRWEDITDAIVQQRPARAAFAGQPEFRDLRQQLVSKDKNTPVWNINESFNANPDVMASRRQAFYDYLAHVKDYLDTNVRAEDLHRYDLVRAVKETSQWDKELAKNMEKKQKDSMKDVTVHKDYGDGFKWIKLDKPGQFAQESDMMGHSVRGYEPQGLSTSRYAQEHGIEYARQHPLEAGVHPDWREGMPEGHNNYGLGGWDAIKRGDAEVYSLRDSQGRAHVTIEVEGPRKSIPGYIHPRGHTDIPSITQIKGKQNRAPDEKYLKYVQDFVKSKEWGDVGDLWNTGLIKAPRQGSHPELGKAFPTEYISTDEARRALSDAVPRRVERDYAQDKLTGLSKKAIIKQQQEYINELSSSELQRYVDNWADDIVMSRLEQVKYDRDGNPINFPYKEGGYAFTDFKRELQEKGIKVSDAAAKAMYDASTLAEKPKAPPAHPKGDAVQFSAKVPGLERIKQEYKDDRTWEEMLPAAHAHKDVGMVHKNVTAKIVGGKYTAGDHPLWSWISSQIHSIKHMSMQRAADMLHGKSRKNPDPGTYNYTWRQLTGKEREAVNDFAWKHNNSDKPVTSADLATLNPKQRQAYQDRVAINKKVLADVNKKLVEEGKQPIPELPNYWSPIIVDDPFVVKFKDAAGETKKIAGFYRKPDVKALEKIAAEHGMTAELMPEKGLRGELDFEQIEWVLRQLSKEQRDPAARGLSEGLRRQGFMKHGLKRKGVEGGEGSMGGRRGLREYEETSEKYIRRAYEWISNRELDALYKKVLDETTLDKQPYAKAFALEALDTARGGANKSFEGFSKAVGDIVSGAIQVGTLGKLKLPNRFARDLLRHSNKVKTTLLLGFGNVTNIAANILQAPSYGVPAMMAVAAKAGANIGQMAVAVPKALAKTSAEMLKWDDSSDIKKLRELGALDATFKYDWSTYASDMDPRYRNTAVEHLTGISTLSYIESNAVRRPASLMFLNILREIGYDKIAKTPDEIYYVAKEMTDKYMVSTRWYEKPHMFSRSGIVGTATSPLQSFTTTWLGMLKEYAQLSKEGLLQPSIAKQAPLVTFLAMNVMTAGLLGLIGIKEWDALATFANKHFGMNIPTGTEWIMSKFKDNKVRFGLLSDAVGVHIGATFNAPTLTGSFAPGAQMIGDVANFGYQMGRSYGDELGLGTSAPTAVERREAKKGVTPRFNWLDRATEAAGMGSMGFNWGDIEQKATPRNAPYQDMAGNAGPITRDSDDWNARKFGTYTTKEATAKTENYLAQRTADERSQRLSKIIGRAADILVMNPDDPNIMAKIEPIIAKAEADNFKGNEIRDALKREVLTKYIESDTRAIGKGQTSRQAYIYKLLESLR